MSERQPLPSKIEDALDVLATTEDLAEGEAAEGLASNYFAQFNWVEWLGLVPVVIAFVGLGFRDQAWGEAILLLGLLLGVANIFLRHHLRRVWNLDRYQDALNRFRQIAGTLAVRSQTP
jgi:hypothetical protein